MADPSLTIVKHDLNGINAAPHARIETLVNFGSSYAALTKAALLVLLNARLAAIRADFAVTAIDAVAPSPSQDGLIVPNWDNANSRLEAKVFDAGAQGVLSGDTITVVDSASLTLDGGKLSEALPATCVAVIGGRSSGGTAGVIKMVGDAPANTLEARFIPASRKVQLLAADSNTGLIVQYVNRVPAALSAGTAPSWADAAGDLSNAAKSVSVTFICTK